MRVLRTHVEFKHRVKIGDPISKWAQAAQDWDKKHPVSSSNSEGAPTIENKGGSELTPTRPNAPALRVGTSNILNSEAKKGPSKNESIATNTSALAKKDSAGDTLLSLEKKITSAQSQFEARCAAVESKIQANCNTKITELQTANAVSQSQFESRCADVQSKLQADIVKLTR